MQIVNRMEDAKNNDIVLKSEQSLAPSYNEILQITDFLESIIALNSIDQEKQKDHHVNQNYIKQNEES